jgi:cystathionine gamma-synthase
MTESSKQGLSTRTIHGHSFKDAHGSPHLPVYDTTTFAFKSTADLLDVVDGRKPGSLYTRYGLNPSIFAIEETLASLEGAEMAWSFCSGMAAETALFLTHGREGIVCIGDAYGGTLELLASQLPLLGIKTHLILGRELDQLDALLAAGAKLVFFETPTNPPSNCSTFGLLQRRRTPTVRESRSTTRSLHRSISARWNWERISSCIAPPSISADTATSPPAS